MSLQLRIPPVVWIAVCGGLMWASDRWVPIAEIIVAPAHRAGWLLITLGAAVIATAVIQFRRAKTTVDPTKPAKASALVRTGIFSYSRNPMYLGMGIGLAGWAVMLGSLGPWLVLPLFAVLLTWLQIKPEEAVLSTLFGREYEEYCARVGRWFGRRRTLTR